MPCSDLLHSHNDEEWPEADAEIEIYPCELYCGYCGKQNSSASDLRRHVYTNHIDPAKKEATHPTITIKDYNGDRVKHSRAWQQNYARRVRGKPNGDGGVEAAVSTAAAIPVLRRSERKKKTISKATANGITPALATAPAKPANRSIRLKLNFRKKHASVSNVSAAAVDRDDEEQPLNGAAVVAKVEEELVPEAELTPVGVNAQPEECAREEGQGAGAAEKEDLDDDKEDLCPENFRHMSVADLEREHKINKARLEQSRLVSRELLIEAELARRVAKK